LELVSWVDKRNIDIRLKEPVRNIRLYQIKKRIDHVERKVPKYEKHKRERKVRTLTEN
jgi:hypothetical protein